MIFEENELKSGLELLERKNFTEYNIDIKRKMSPIQLRVSSYYMSMVFINKN